MMMNRLVVSWPDDGLAEALACILDCDRDTCMTGRFTDGETRLVQYPAKNLHKRDVLLVASFRFWESNKQQSSINDQLFAVWYMLHFLKQSGVARITLVLPYLPYSREKTAKTSLLACMIDVFHHAGAHALITSDIHQQEMVQQASMPISCCMLTLFWRKIVEEHVLSVYAHEDICFVAPDFGGINRARSLAHCFDQEPVLMTKKRVVESHIELMLSDDVQGKVVIIVDDIVDTGMTAAQGAELLHARGARAIIGFFTHAVFSGDAVSRVADSYFDRIFVTDTIRLDACQLPPLVVRLSMHHFFAQEIARILA